MQRGRDQDVLFLPRLKVEVEGQGAGNLLAGPGHSATLGETSSGQVFHDVALRERARRRPIRRRPRHAPQPIADEYAHAAERFPELQAVDRTQPAVLPRRIHLDRPNHEKQPALLRLAGCVLHGIKQVTGRVLIRRAARQRPHVERDGFRLPGDGGKREVIPLHALRNALRIDGRYNPVVGPEIRHEAGIFPCRLEIPVFIKKAFRKVARQADQRPEDLLLQKLQGIKAAPAFPCGKTVVENRVVISSRAA